MKYDIIIIDGRRYNQCKETLPNGDLNIKQKQLCLLEKCKNLSIKGMFCNKHTIEDHEQICEKCLSVNPKEECVDGHCEKCQEYVYNQNSDFKSFITIKDGVKYKTFPCGMKKICQIDMCEQIACGDFCKKHKPHEIKEHEKKCHRCHNVKEKEEFIENDIIYENCHPCRDGKRQRSLIRHQKRRKFILQLKINMGGKCVDCNTPDLELLEFDHVIGDKITEVKRINNYQGMIDEAKKCVLRCSRCHIIKTKNTVTKPTIDENINTDTAKYGRKHREKARNYIENIKLNSGGCCECGWFDENYLEGLHFDHIDPETKKYNISNLQSVGSSLKTIQSEIDKTRIICSNCHRKHTLRQFDYPILDLIKNI